MPVLTEYFIPTTRGWFAFFDSQHEGRGMLGILGLYGARWTNAVANMWNVFVADGKAVMRASLESGRRYWMAYVGPVEKQFTPQRRFVFHRLHAEFNALRLDEHLDLTAKEIYDASCWEQPGFFGCDYRERAIKNASALLPLHKVVETKWHLTLQTLIDPSGSTRQALLDRLLQRCEKWVLQFQGFREGKHDYSKNVIGFSRTVRGLLIDYELLRKDRYLDDAQIGKLNAYFIFAARRILDASAPTRTPPLAMRGCRSNIVKHCSHSRPNWRRMIHCVTT